MKRIASKKSYAAKITKEEREQQLTAIRQTSADIEPSAEVLAAALKAIRGNIPMLDYQVTERDVRVILSDLHRAGFSVVKS
jgi:hypothetical protein|tara:strand:+ start:230 stop:472 length:243 start_codon:yes stop_codon:yes gene_type:complete